MQQLVQKLRAFAAERDWEQFHTPKNLACAISVEAAELLEIFQWSRGANWGSLQDEAVGRRTEEELADIFLYLLRFADLAKIDLIAAAEKKIENNRLKYPVERSKGSDAKYNE